MSEKQPQTCYVEVDNDFGIELSLLNGEVALITKLESVYIHTPEELEALKAEWQREAAENTIKWVLSNMDFEDIGAHVPLYDYLDQYYPKPQPINTNL